MGEAVKVSKNKEGKLIDYSYCDVWKFTDGKMAKLKAFVIEEIKNELKNLQTHWRGENNLGELMFF